MNLNQIKELDIELRIENMMELPFHYFEIEEEGELRVYGEISGTDPVLVAIDGKHIA